jgi:hypothetical protein
VRYSEAPETMENLLAASSSALRGGSPPQIMLWRSHPSHLPPGVSGGLDAIHKLNCRPGSTSANGKVKVDWISIRSMDDTRTASVMLLCHAHDSSIRELSCQCLFSEISLEVAEWRRCRLKRRLMAIYCILLKEIYDGFVRGSRCDLRNSLNLCFPSPPSWTSSSSLNNI